MPSTSLSLDSHRELVLRVPVSGVLVALEKVPDPVFAQKIVGLGVAIDPTGQEILAPCDGSVSRLHSAGHAVAITTREGIEILIHIGLDTVKLKGDGFSPLVRMGAEVHEGQPLIRFDADLIAQKAKSLLTEVIVTNPDRIEDLQISKASSVTARDPLIRVRLRGVSHGHPAAPAAGRAVKSDAVEIVNPSGLHARPAAVLASLAKTYKSEISILKGNRSANIRSLVGIMGLEIEKGDRVILEARGSDAKQAIDALIREIRNGLGEGGGAHAPAAKPEPKSLAAQPFRGDRFPGVVASPGRAVGRIFQLKSQDMAVQEQGESQALETERLEDALRQAKQQLEALSSRLQKEADSSKALIFTAHQELLEDPSLLEIARGEIGRGKSAAYSWKAAYLEISSQLEGLNNQLLAARAHDVKDVGQRVLHLLAGGKSAQVQYPSQCILVAEDLIPSDVATLDRGKVLGLVTTTGGATSHVAILARSLDLPALAGVDPRILGIESGTLAALDATHGELRLSPSTDEVKRFEAEKASHEVKKKEEQAHALEPARTRDGRRVEVVANLKASNESASALRLGAEGVGLLRTEFLFMDRSEAPTEEEQLESYRAIAKAFGKNRPLIIRTLDVGGDKPLQYLPLPREENPFLGERGLRVSLNRPEFFRVQLRAILRAAADGDVRVMFPMVSTLGELRQAKAIFEEERKRLGARAIPVGIMVEVPSVAILAEQFAAESDFFSIGSNDLSQYTLAIDRGHPKLAALVDGLDPSLLHLIDRSVRAAHARGKWVGVCGGIASDPQAVPFLIGLGVDELSASVPAIPAIKAQIRRLEQKECEKLAQRALRAESAEEVRSWIRLED